jgi:sialate O-acetylesterase
MRTIRAARSRVVGAVLAASGLLPTLAEADLTAARLFGDRMVVQRDVEIPVWGTATPGARVEVALGGATRETVADGAGRWAVRFDALPAGGPHELTVEGDAERIVIRDVRVGDVWVCSGQSNMEWVVADSKDAAAEIAAARDGAIRHFKVPRSWSAEPRPELAGGAWEAASPETVGSFTAVGYFFARELRAELGVPIGLVNATWGGSRIEPWMSAEALGLDAAGSAALLEREEAFERQVLERLGEQLGDPPAPEAVAAWKLGDFDDASWSALEVPGRWEEQGYEWMDGVAWYRTELELGEAEAAAGIDLSLGMIDDSDTAFLNGREIGATRSAWNRERLYRVPPAALRPGANVLAVRVEDTGGGGGFHGDPERLFVETVEGRRPLAGSWRFAVESVAVNLEDHKRELPALLYNAMIHPLHRFPVRGFLWYQGESNAGDEDAFVYRDLFAGMIGDWRQRWGQGDLPFLFVQLASWLPPPVEPEESGWAMLRESQSAALGLPATAQAVAIDAGDADDIHPRDKQTLGHRLALAALDVAYGHDLISSGPTYRSHAVRDGRVEIELDHVGGGLVARDAEAGRLRGFAVAGADREFVWAEARIEGDRVVVWSDEVGEPVAARYAWAANPAGANLYNREGLPASPFRTDRW